VLLGRGADDAERLGQQGVTAASAVGSPAVNVIACLGHWYVSLIYAAPALLLGGGVLFSTMRQKRRQQATGMRATTRIAERKPATLA
jgi:hypothetical protein